MDDNEQFVRARWENVRITSTVVNGYVVVRRLSAEPLKVEKLWVGTLCACSEADAWSAARAFTEARLESIRLVKEEIAFIEARLITANIKEMPIRSRIVQRVQSALAELKVGMKS